MAGTERRTLEIVARVKDVATREFTRLARVTATVGRRMRAAFSGVASTLLSLRTLVAGFFAVLAGRAAIASVRSVADELDNMAKSARRLQVGFEDLAGLDFAASLAGIDFNRLSVGLRRMNANALEAAEGNVKLLEAWEAFGVQVTDSSGKIRNVIDLLADMADGYRRLGEGAERSALLQRIFGGRAADIASLLNDGGQALRDYIEQGKRFAAITKDQGTAAESFNDSILRFTTSVRALWRSLVVQILPNLTTWLNGLAVLLAENREQIIAMFRAFLSGAKSAFLGLVRFAAAGIDKIRELALAMDEMPLIGSHRFSNAVKRIEEIRRRIAELSISVPSAEDIARSGVGGFHRRAGTGTPEQIRDRLLAARQVELEALRKEFIELNKLVNSFTSQTTAGSFADELEKGFDAIEKAAKDANKSLSVMPRFLDDIGESARVSLPQARQEFDSISQGMADLVQQLRNETRTIRDATISVTRAFVDGFSGAIADAIVGVKSLKDAFRDMALSIIQMIIRMSVQMAVWRGFLGLFGGGGAGGSISTGAAAGFSGGGGIAGGVAGGFRTAGAGFGAGGAGGPVVLNLSQSNSFSGGDSREQQRQAQRVAQETAAAVVGALGRTPALASRVRRLVR